MKKIFFVLIFLLGACSNSNVAINEYIINLDQREAIAPNTIEGVYKYYLPSYVEKVSNDDNSAELSYAYGNILININTVEYLEKKEVQDIPNYTFKQEYNNGMLYLVEKDNKTIIYIVKSGVSIESSVRSPNVRSALTQLNLIAKSLVLDDVVISNLNKKSLEVNRSEEIIKFTQKGTFTDNTLQVYDAVLSNYSSRTSEFGEGTYSNEAFEKSAVQKDEINTYNYSYESVGR